MIRLLDFLWNVSAKGRPACRRLVDSPIHQDHVVFSPFGASFHPTMPFYGPAETIVTSTNALTKKRVLVVASGGGHWEEMMLLRHAFAHHEVGYVTTLPGLAAREGITRHYLVPDCNRNNVWRLAKCFVAMAVVIVRSKPDVIISTGALPGLIGMIVGKYLGKRTVWIDSVANAEELSLAGAKARKYADLWLTQSRQVAMESGARFAGSIL